MKFKPIQIAEYHQEPNIFASGQYSLKTIPKIMPSHFIVNELLTIKTKASIFSSEILIYVLLRSVYYFILMAALASIEAENLYLR